MWEAFERDVRFDMKAMESSLHAHRKTIGRQNEIEDDHGENSCHLFSRKF